MSEILDCGHEPTPQEPGSCTTGIARSPEGKTLCFDCAKNSIIRHMHDDGEALLYMDGLGRHVTTWDGQVIAPVVEINRSRGNFGDTRVYFRFRFGTEVWTGMGQGGGMYCKVRRTKLKSIFG